jgi:hypothetical protein
MALPYDIDHYRRVGEAIADPKDCNMPATGEDILALVAEVERLTAIIRNLVPIGDCDCGVCDTCSSLVENALADKGLGLDGKPIR